MKVLPQWVVWKPEWKHSKWGKVPYTPLGRKASSTDPKSWADLDTVAKAADESGAGIGFVVAVNGYITGIDLDKCRDPVTGSMEQWALQIVAGFNSYSY